jgi:hypothetical protein
MEQTLSPEAVEALAKSLAAKIEFHKKGVGELANEVIQFREADKKFKEEDAAFKAEVRAALNGLKVTRIDVPLIAAGLSVLSILFATLALINNARANQRTADELRDVRAHITVEHERRQTQGN